MSEGAPTQFVLAPIIINEIIVNKRRPFVKMAVAPSLQALVAPGFRFYPCSMFLNKMLQDNYSPSL